MTNLASARHTQPANFTRGEAGEVVVVHELLGLGKAEAVEHLLLSLGTKRRDSESLCLATCEKAGTVGARQHANLTGNGANLIALASINMPAGLENVLSHVLLQLRVVDVGYFLFRILLIPRG